jgi:hypothetical protein
MAKRRIRVSRARRKHILDGDATGGGHGPGRGKAGKSEFPPTLTDQEIIDGVESIANDPNNYPGGVIPSGGKPIRLTGSIKGVRAVVIADPARDDVKSAWPDGIAPNP